MTSGISEVLLALVKPSSLDEPIGALEKQRASLRDTIRAALHASLMRRNPHTEPALLLKRNQTALERAEERLFERHGSELDRQISILRDLRPSRESDSPQSADHPG